MIFIYHPKKLYGLYPGKGRGWGEVTPHMKVVGMLVVSLRGVNFGFWSHLGGQLFYNVVSFRGQKKLEPPT